MPYVHNERGVRLYYDHDTPPEPATSADDRAEQALIEAEALADRLYTVSRMDCADALPRIGALERLNAAIDAALREIE